MKNLQEKKYLTLKQAGDRIQTPSETIRYWVNVGKLQAYKPGRKLLILETELDELVQASAKTPNVVKV